MTPTPTTLQVILVDELQRGDVVIVNLQDRLESAAAFQMTYDQWKGMFPQQRVVINDGRGSVEIKRPSSDSETAPDQGNTDTEAPRP